MNEFQLIHRYFTKLQSALPELLVGIGDDAAVLRWPEQTDFALAADMLVAGVHFPIETSPFDIGYKALAVNLSDMAAMGANPRCYTLTISLPNQDESWLAAFTEGLLQNVRDAFIGQRFFQFG